MNYQNVQLHTTYHSTQVSKKSLAGPVKQTLCLICQCTVNKLYWWRVTVIWGSCATQCVIGLITDYIIPSLSVGLPPDCNKLTHTLWANRKIQWKKTAVLKQLLRFIPAVTHTFGCLTQTSMRTLMSRFINTKYLYCTVTWWKTYLSCE